MNTRLYVGNLSFNTNAEGVRAAFQEFGTVSDVHLVSDRETGRSRGFAFVEMTSDADAQAAIKAVRRPALDSRAAASAASVPAWPPPTTITSNSLGNRIALPKI